MSRINGSTQNRFSVWLTGYGDPGRASKMLQLDIARDQSIEQGLHAGVVGRRLKRTGLAFDRQHHDRESLLHQM